MTHRTPNKIRSVALWTTVTVLLTVFVYLVWTVASSPWMDFRSTVAAVGTGLAYSTPLAIIVYLLAKIASREPTAGKASE